MATSPSGRSGGVARRWPARSSRCRRWPWPCPGSRHAWPKSAACWSPAMPLTGTPPTARGHAGWPRAEAPAGRADLGQGAGRDAEELEQLVGPAPGADVVEQGSAGVAGVGGEHPVRDAPGQLPQQPRVDGPERQSGDRPSTPGAWASSQPSWWPRSRGRAPGRCGPGPEGGARPRSARRSARRYGGPARRWRGAAPGRYAGPRRPPSRAGW